MRMSDKGSAPLCVMLMATAALGWGCLSPAAVNPPIVTATPMGLAMRPAKPPDCAMPVLDSMPLANHQQLALLDAWGDLAVKDDELLTYLKREGCRLGADAVVLTSEQKQHEGDLVRGVAPGRFGNIGPGSEAALNRAVTSVSILKGAGKRIMRWWARPAIPAALWAG